MISQETALIDLTTAFGHREFFHSVGIETQYGQDLVLYTNRMGSDVLTEVPETFADRKLLVHYAAYKPVASSAVSSIVAVKEAVIAEPIIEEEIEEIDIVIEEEPIEEPVIEASAIKEEETAAYIEPEAITLPKEETIVVKEVPPAIDLAAAIQAMKKEAGDYNTRTLFYESYEQRQPELKLSKQFPAIRVQMDGLLKQFGYDRVFEEAIK